MAVLEAKLNSIPGLDFGAGDLPPAAAPAVDQPQVAAGLPDVPLPDVDTPNAAPGGCDVAVAEAPQSNLPEGMVQAKDHPDYAKFFKLVKLGVPGPVVAAKMRAEDLDDSCLDNPEKLVPESGQIEGLD